MKHLWKSFTENPTRVFVALIIDVLSLYIYGFVTNPLRNRIINNGAESISAHLRGQSAFSLELIALFILFLVVTYLVWVLWQASTWHITRLLVGMKTQFIPYLIDIAKINLLWIPLYGLFLVADIYFSIRAILIRAIIPDYTNLPSLFVAVASLIVLYFAIISHPTRSISKSFSEGLHLHTFTTILILLVILYLLDKSLKILPYDVGLLIGFFALILFTPARMIITHVTNHGIRTRS